MNDDIKYNYKQKYSISACNVATYGYDGNPKQKWILGKNTSPYWNHHRIWLIEKGTGTVNTLYGDYELTEGNVYYFPGTSIIGANCSHMKQFYLDFITVDHSSLFNSRYDLYHVSDKYSLIYELLRVVYDRYREKTEINVLICDSAIDTVLSLFVRKTEDSFKLLFHKVLSYIDENFCRTDNISSAELARISNYSQQHFVKKFKEAFSLSPKKYIINKKIIRACHLLSTTGESIKDIALSCGFIDEFYFSKIFAKKIGASPSQYRKQSLLEIKSQNPDGDLQ